MDLVGILKEHLEKYPLVQPQDLVKLIYQNEFGGGHMISSAAAAAGRIETELAELEGNCGKTVFSPPEAVEYIGNGLCRFHLAYLRDTGISAKTLGMVFYLSAAAVRGSRDSFMHNLEIAVQACREGRLDFDPDLLKKYLRFYKQQGLTHPGHSDIFKQNYNPAYRVIEADYPEFFQILAAIDSLLARKKSVVIALEGNSGAGKSALAERLGKIYQAAVIHTDDFFLRPEQRTEQRYAEPGGNIDYERFREEITANLGQEKEFSYRRFDCRSMELAETVKVTPARLIIIEGVYSMHPRLAPDYDLKVFLSISASGQEERILRRNGPEMLKRFRSEWIPMENEYFTAFAVRDNSDLILEVEII